LEGEGRTTRVLVAVPIVVVIVMDALYVAIIVNQSSQGTRPPDVFTFPFIVTYLAVIAVLLMVSLIPRRGAGVRSVLRASSAGGLLVLGVLAMFSIGLPLVIAGAMGSAATARMLLGRRGRLSALSTVVGATIAVAILIAGFEVTQRLIVCPAHGSSGGGGSGFVTGPYQYECVEGKLSFRSG
jgi:hypothetical protein